MVAFDRGGAVVQKWSWKTLEPQPAKFDAMEAVTDSNGGQMKLVQLRPLSADVLPSIKEGRAVKTASSYTF